MYVFLFVCLPSVCLFICLRGAHLYRLKSTHTQKYRNIHSHIYTPCSLSLSISCTHTLIPLTVKVTDWSHNNLPQGLLPALLYPSWPWPVQHRDSTGSPWLGTIISDITALNGSIEKHLTSVSSDTPCRHRAHFTSHLSHCYAQLKHTGYFFSVQHCLSKQSKKPQGECQGVDCAK